MRLLYFVFSILCFVSCGDDSISASIKNQNKPIVTDIPMPLFSGDMVFNDEFVTKKSFSNGDPILHAQSKASWIKAAAESLPAWCYADSIKKQGVLYNAYCLLDKRELGANLRLMNEIDGALFISDFDAPEVTEAAVYLTERNYQGNFYNLGFQNIWIKSNNEDLGMKYVLSYHPSRAIIQLRKAHPGNGYFIRTMKAD